MAQDLYKGYSLFADVEDFELQTRNRGATMANILQENFDADKVSPRGASLLAGYLFAIEPGDRKYVMKQFIIQANERGFKING